MVGEGSAASRGRCELLNLATLRFTLEHFRETAELLRNKWIAAVVGSPAAVLGLAEKVLLGGHD